MDEKLLLQYQQELSFIRKLGDQFSKSHPKIASHLQLEAKTTQDPHVARLIEAFALANARIQQKLTHDCSEISNALLNLFYPDYLAPIPSLSVVQLQTQSTQLFIPSNTQLASDKRYGEVCHFTTCYPVELFPIIVQQAQLHSKPLIASIISELTHTASILQISLRCIDNKLFFSELEINKLRFFINTQKQHAYAIYELLFKHTIAIALANSVTDPHPIILNKSHFSPVGFKPTENILPDNKRNFAGYRLLTEFFAFPEKFLFFDITHLADKIKQKFTKPGATLEILFYLDSTNPLLEKNITTSCFTLGCTPIINLFRQYAEPFILNHTQTEYHLIPDARQPPQTTEIYTVQRVIASTADEHETEYQPFYGAKGQKNTPYYYANRKPGTEIFLSFIDPNFDPNVAKEYVISAELLCTNRHLPSKLPFGGTEPHLHSTIDDITKIICLTPITTHKHAPLDAAARWHQNTHLTLNYLSLVNDADGIDVLRSLLKLYAFDQNDEHQNLLEGLLSIQRKPASKRNPNTRYGNLFWQGTQIIIEVDENKFIGSSLYLFGCILERFFALYTTINSFTELIFINKQHNIIHHWPPRASDEILF